MRDSAPYYYYYQSRIVNGVTWSCTGVATVFVCSRLISRTLLAKGKAGVDDAIIVLAHVVVVACNICASLSVISVSHEQPENAHQASKELIAMNALMVWTFALPKLAILALLQRIFIIPKYYLISFWTLCFVTISGTFATSVVWAASCKSAPGDAPSMSLPGGHCKNKDAIQVLMWATGALSAYGDLLFSVYPQFLISKLNMPLQKKVAYGLALGLGVLAFAASVYKLTLYPRGFFVSQTAQKPDMNIVFWALVESNVLIITACLPSLGPLYIFVKEKKGPCKHAETLRHRRLRDEHTIGSPPEQEKSPARPETRDALTRIEDELKHQSRQFRDSLRMVDKLAGDDGLDNDDVRPTSTTPHEYRGEIMKRVDIEQWQETRDSREPLRDDELGLSFGEKSGGI